MKNKYLELYKTDWKSWGFKLSGFYNEDYYTPELDKCGREECNLHLMFGNWRLKIDLPLIIRPKEKIIVLDKKTYNRVEFDSQRMKNGELTSYIQYINREYGIYYSILDFHHITINYGTHPDDTSLAPSQYKIYYIPWLENTYLGKYYFYPDNETIFGFSDSSYQNEEFLDEQVPKYKFKLLDFDGEEIEATCFIYSLAYSKGIGLFRWLKYFFDNQYYRRINIEFNKEFGDRKNSWKGGTWIMSYQIDKDSKIEDIIDKFCKENGCKFIEVIE